jgi:hypothetical protein
MKGQKKTLFMLYCGKLKELEVDPGILWAERMGWIVLLLIILGSKIVERIEA